MPSWHEDARAEKANLRGLVAGGKICDKGLFESDDSHGYQLSLLCTGQLPCRSIAGYALDKGDNGLAAFGRAVAAMCGKRTRRYPIAHVLGNENGGKKCTHIQL